MADSIPSVLDWVKLTESDYAKVIFRDVQRQYSLSASILCSFEISDDIKPTPKDYVGLFPVGFCDLSQCIARQNVKEDKRQVVTFTVEQLQKKKEDFYQFLYIGENDAIHGASIPFLLQDTGEDVITDEDFLVINPPSCEVFDGKEINIEEAPLEKPATNVGEKIVLKPGGFQIVDTKQEPSGIISAPPVSSGEITSKADENILSDQKLEYEKQLKSKDEMIAELSSELGAVRTEQKKNDSVISVLQKRMGEISKEKEELYHECLQLKASLVNYGDAKSMLSALQDSKHLCILEMKRLEAENRRLQDEMRQKEKMYEERSAALKDLEIKCQKYEMLNSDGHVKCENCSKLITDLNLAYADLFENHCPQEKEAIVQVDSNDADESVLDPRLLISAIYKCSVHLASEVKELRAEVDQATNKLVAAQEENSTLLTQLKEAESREQQVRQESEKAIFTSKKFYDSQLDGSFKIRETLEEKVSKLEKNNNMLKSMLTAAMQAKEDRTKELVDKLSDSKTECVMLKSMLATAKEDGKKQVERKEQELQAEIGDMRKRLESAAKIYRMQYVEILRIRKTLQKYRDAAAKHKAGSAMSQSVVEAHTADDEIIDRLVADSMRFVEKQKENQANVDAAKQLLQVYMKSKEDAAYAQCLAEEEEDERLCQEFECSQQNQSCCSVEKEMNSGASASIQTEDTSLSVETIICHICSETFPVVGGDNGFLIDHLDKVHNQKTCPVCGMVFESNLPPQYLKCHIEAHFSPSEMP